MALRVLRVSSFFFRVFWALGLRGFWGFFFVFFSPGGGGGVGPGRHSLYTWSQAPGKFGFGLGVWGFGGLGVWGFGGLGVWGFGGLGVWGFGGLGVWGCGGVGCLGF